MQISNETHTHTHTHTFIYKHKNIYASDNPKPLLVSRVP